MTARKAIAKSRSDAITQRFAGAAGDCAATWRVAQDVLHRGKRPVYSDNESRTLVTGFSKFFVNKLLDIRQSITSSLRYLGGHFVFIQPQHNGPALSLLSPTTATEVRKVLTSTRLKPSPLDILPVSLLRQSIDVIAPALAHSHGKPVIRSVPFSDGV